jgi:hypothetical protein
MCKSSVSRVRIATESPGNYRDGSRQIRDLLN